MSCANADLESLTKIPIAELIRRVAAGEVTWRTGHCAGCNREYLKGEQHVASGMWRWPMGLAMYTLCWRCSPRMQNAKFRARYRAAIKLAGTRQSRWQRITRHQDHAADDCRWQALLSDPLIVG
jgi:hypothetical protein